jgi:hypothetical protein
MAVIRTVEIDHVPVYISYFDITLIPALIFFYNAKHIKVDFRSEKGPWKVTIQESRSYQVDWSVLQKAGFH